MLRIWTFLFLLIATLGAWTFAPGLCHHLGAGEASFRAESETASITSSSSESSSIPLAADAEPDLDCDEDCSETDWGTPSILPGLTDLPSSGWISIQHDGEPSVSRFRLERPPRRAMS